MSCWSSCVWGPIAGRRARSGSTLPWGLRVLLLPAAVYLLWRAPAVRAAAPFGPGEALAGRVEELARIVGQGCRHWPHTRIGIRGDSGFCREPILRWREDNGVDSVLGLARNKRLVGAIGARMRRARAAHRRMGTAARRYRDFEDATRKSWSHNRRVVGKEENLTRGETPRFGVTRLPTRRAAAKRLSEKLSCARRQGDPHQRAAARPVRRPHQRAKDAREPAAPVRLLLRLCTDAVTSNTQRPGHRAGPRSGLHPAAQAVEGRDTDRHYGPSGVAVLLPGLYPYARVFAEGLANLQREPLWREPG